MTSMGSVESRKARQGDERWWGFSVEVSQLGFGLASHNGQLYAVGGQNALFATLNSVEVFNGTSWSTLETSLATARRRLGLASYGGLLYAVGDGPVQQERAGARVVTITRRWER